MSAAALQTLTTMEWLFGGLVAILALASSVTWLLARRKGGESSPVIQNLRQRVNAWWGMVAVFAVAFLLGPIVTLVLFGLSSFFALREFITLTPTTASDHRPLVLAFYFFLPLQYVLIGVDWYGLFSIAIPVYAFLVLPSVSAIVGDTEQFLVRSAKTQWGLMLCVYCLSHAPALLLLDIPRFSETPSRNALLLFFLIFVAQISDVMQYVFGKLFGRHPVAPVVSPSKTWEGLVFGGLAATGLGAAMYWITPFQPWQAALLALLIVVAGFLGGLTLSAIKRGYGVKDWGAAIPGHGGVLDRFDSVTFAAPLFFHMTRYFFTP